MRTPIALLALVLGLAIAVAPATAETERADHDCVRGNELWFRSADRV